MLGGQRCGSTWVDQAIRHHPKIHLPAKKQTYFFDSHFEKGLDWYLQKFESPQPSDAIIGEVATNYCLEDVLPKVARALPDIKVILSVRNPIERTISYYNSRKEKFGWKSIEEAIEVDDNILKRGQYIDQIEAILSHYPKERFLLLFYDDLVADDRAYLNKILSFLGVDTDFDSPAIGKRIQVSAFPRVRKIAKTLHAGKLLDLTSRSSIGDFIRKRIKSTKSSSAGSIAPSSYAMLLDHFQSYNSRLSDFTGRDLEYWR